MQVVYCVRLYHVVPCVNVLLYLCVKIAYTIWTTITHIYRIVCSSVSVRLCIFIKRFYAYSTETKCDDIHYLFIETFLLDIWESKYAPISSRNIHKILIYNLLKSIHNIRIQYCVVYTQTNSRQNNS